MLGVDPGVLEIRIPAEMGNGIFSVSGVEDLLLVLHTFVKNTQKTSQRDIELTKE